jgi:predicted dehydrogenase
MEKKKEGKIKILFFGIGSIGKKHASIIKNNYDFNLYAYRTDKGQEKNDLKIEEFNSLNDAFSINPDIAFITNPTFLHVETALECTRRNIDIFIEKPISNSLEQVDLLDSEVKKNNIFTYVAYNMRFHPVIKNLKEMVSEKDTPIYFSVTCRSYLPDWRPGQDYSKSYSAKNELGGGVILDLSHEFDYIYWLFGEIKKIDGICGKISDLKIDSEDILIANLTCYLGIKGNLHLDYFSLNAERKIKIYYDDELIEGDLIKNTIKIIKGKKEKIIKFKIDLDETYKKQIDYFFKQYKSKNYDIINNYSEALKTFKKIMSFKKDCNWI